MSESDNKTHDGERIIIGTFDPVTGRTPVVSIKSKVADLTDELVQTLNYETEQNAVLVEKMITAARIKNYLRAVDHFIPGTKKTRVTIERAPGYQLLGFLSKVCPKRFVERELSALHADGIASYYERLDAGDVRGAKLIKWSMRGWMLWAVIGGAVSSILRVFTGKTQPSE